MNILSTHSTLYQRHDLKLSSTSLCVPIIGPDVLSASKQIERVLAFADCLELRLDLFHSFDILSLHKLREKITLPFILTLRKKSEGGGFQGTESDRLDLLHQLMDLEPDCVDVEWDVPDEIIDTLKKNRRAKFLISYHNFKETPPLEDVWRKIYRKQGDVYKIATTSHSILDSLRMMEFVATINAKVPLSGMCMQADGAATRVLSPLIRSPLVYACENNDLATAPGQISADALLNTYNFRSLVADSFLLGLIGDPIDKSISHLSYNRVLKNLGLLGVHTKFRVRAEELGQFFKLMKSFNTHGLHVTMPLKEAVLPF